MGGELESRPSKRQGAVDVRGSTINHLGVFALKMFREGDFVLEIDDSHVVDEGHPLVEGDDPVIATIWRLVRSCSCDFRSGISITLAIRRSRQDCRWQARCGCAAEDFCRGGVVYDYCIHGDGDTVWNCNCGATRCRRVIHSDFFHLPAELQREYLPLLDDWFRREHLVKIARLLR